MNRRGFFGALAALGGAAAAKRLIQQEPPATPAPVVTSGYLQYVNADLNGPPFTITTNAATNNTVYLDYAMHMRGEGTQWSYTATQ